MNERTVPSGKNTALGENIWTTKRYSGKLPDRQLI